VGRQHAMEANEMKPGARDEGRQALQEFQRAHDEMSGAIAIGSLELQHDLAGWGTAQSFVAQGGACNVATEPFEGLPLMGTTLCVGSRLE